MNSLFQFLYKYRALAIFLLLELVCAWLIIQNNSYQGVAFFNSANTVAASVTQTSNDVSSYLYLKEANESLAQENAFLKERLSQMQQRLSIPGMQTAVAKEVEQQFSFEAAQVINNSVNRPKNFLTLNKGKADGVLPGMAIIGPQGVVGKVKSASENFAVGVSLLHSGVYVSAMLKGNNSQAFGSVHWNGENPNQAKLDFIARHQQVQVGDTVVTSSYNSVFPTGVPVGRVSEVELPQNATYYDITVDLATDFSSLAYVYVIRNRLIQERDSLEQISTQ
jgi:rod shape-determining protein MreC